MKKILFLIILLAMMMVVVPVFAYDYDETYTDWGTETYTITRTSASYQSVAEAFHYLKIAHREYYNGLTHYQFKSKGFDLAGGAPYSKTVPVTVKLDTAGGTTTATGYLSYTYLIDTQYYYVTLNLAGNGIVTTGESGSRTYYLDYVDADLSSITYGGNADDGVCDHTTDPNDYDIGFHHTEANIKFWCEKTGGNDATGTAGVDWHFDTTLGIDVISGTLMNITIERNGLASLANISSLDTTYYLAQEDSDVNLLMYEPYVQWNITNIFSDISYTGDYYNTGVACTMTLYCRDAMTGNLIHDCDYNIKNLDTNITAYYTDKLNPFIVTVNEDSPLEITVMETTHETWVSTEEYEEEISCPYLSYIDFIYLEPLTTGAPEGFTVAYAKTYWSSTGEWPHYTLPSVYINATGEYGNSSSEMTDATGAAYFFVQKNATYTFTAIKSNYQSDIQIVDIGDDPVNLKFVLVPTGALPTTVTMTPTATTTQNYTGINWEKNTAARKGVEWGIVGLIYENGIGIANLFVLWIYMAILGGIFGSLLIFGGKNKGRKRQW